MAVIGRHIEIYGIVQGVGFRPFIHLQTEALGLRGWIRNTTRGAELEVEGEEEALSAFLTALRREAPPLALIEAVEARPYAPLKGYRDFAIRESGRVSRKRTLVAPDAAVCEDCLRELRDPKDRRFRYPFINCTHCGPRFTIIRDLPYDRPFTSMAGFSLCPDCEREYRDIRDRRYHAQPVCCGKCGPRLSFYEGSRPAAESETASAMDRVPAAEGEEALSRSVRLLRAGGILAVKGLGGIHLACLPEEETVRALRLRKQREAKPFALMMRDTETVRRYCLLSPEEEQVLLGRQKPIVLLKKRQDCPFSFVSDNRYVGVMLPYTPLHVLLTEELPVLIMTSANLSDKPILKDNEAALTELSGIADGFLLHDREIVTRCDDSLLFLLRGQEYFLRRSRGYVPYPLILDEAFPQMLALGAEQKASFALSAEQHAFLSAHIGDLKNAETLFHYEQQIGHFERLFDVRPEALLCDLHPDYLSSCYGEERAAREHLPLYRIQHHHAHLASCMADNRLRGEVIGLIWDGTGLGTDGSVWGGEVLTGGYEGFARVSSLYPFLLPGGDKCTRELSRVAEALLWEAYPEGEAARPAGKDGRLLFPEQPALRFIKEQKLNTPVCSSMGRLFDGVCALLGLTEQAAYEGQGAVLLEAAAAEGISRCLPFALIPYEGRTVMDWRPMLRRLCEERSAGVSPAEAAAVFMNTLCAMAVSLCERLREERGLDRVVLSGGCFQNRYLLERLPEQLEKAGFSVYTHHRVSCNDEGICLGQLAVGRALLRKEQP